MKCRRRLCHKQQMCRSTTASCVPTGAVSIQKLPGIQDAVWVECLLETLMQFARNIARRLGPPALLRQADAMFAGYHATPREHLREKFVQRVLHFLTHRRVTIVAIGHDVDVNIAVPCVAEARDWESRTPR